ncbi:MULTISPECIES: EamA family transporter [Ralstonia]|jgi:small multidrug resistance pump|uniref:EamA family transporter n=1 Tax=Ralstonia TaxID=48736 RepID=UPI0015FA2B44|nr:MULTISPECIES: EamA family transporter [Ralstonia]MBB0025677.1 multidrug transporter [Ralstonia pickettii]MBB0036305.1 multidrug transporter [Ralstonia pickettii]MBB0099005.1 multidrug transporter [Ralstonia pickettii]MBB0108639.1 multidrug transporter [Ralstonia pickettii]MBB0129779.1 multidrug transporter [Ralstonia pickettii]
MNWINVVIVMAGILSNASASVLIKIAMRATPLSIESLWQVISNWTLLVGVFMYGCAFVLYAAALSRIPLNVAHPVLTAGAIGAVACASAFLLGETFRWNTIAGLILIALGVIFISITPSS